MALNQVVMPGFAAFRIGIQASDAPVIDSTDPDSELSSTLHTSEIEEVRTQPPVVEEAEDFDDMEGLEDSE
jgi:hypothetical protein